MVHPIISRGERKLHENYCQICHYNHLRNGSQVCLTVCHGVVAKYCDFLLWHRVLLLCILIKSSTMEISQIRTIYVMEAKYIEAFSKLKLCMILTNSSSFAPPSVCTDVGIIEGTLLCHLFYEILRIQNFAKSYAF